MRKRNIAVLLGMALLQGMCFYAPIATLYRQAAGVTVFEMTAIESVSFAVSLLMEVPWGIAADRIGYRKTMIVCTGLFFVSKVVFWRAESFGMFLVERILLAVVVAGLSGVDGSILYLSAGEENAQKVFGLYSAFGTAGLLAASVICSLFVGDDYRLSGLLTVLSYGAAAVLVLLLRDVQEPAEKRKPPVRSFLDGLRQLGRTPGLLPLVLCGALSGEVCRNVSVFFNQLQYTRCGMDERAMAAVYGLSTIVGLCGAFSAAMTKRAGERRMGLMLLWAMAACCAALSVTGNALLSVAAILLLCAASALYGPLSAAVENRLIVTDERATALSVNALITDGVAVPLNLMLGRVADVSLPAALALCAGVCALSAALFGQAAAKMQQKNTRVA